MTDNEQWFRISQLDSNTFMISEPNYWQKNNQYLLIGEKRALLFDSGPGKRDISTIVTELTDVPVIVLGSHAHYDHISGHNQFDHVAIPDLPINRDQVYGSEYRPKMALRFTLRPRHCHVSEWWPVGEPIDLGKRRVELLHLPGHSADSVGLLDHDHDYIFTGDFLYHGPLGAVFPTSSVSDYRVGAQRLLEIYKGEQLFGGHYDPFPALGRASLEDVLDVTERASETVPGSRLTWPLSVHQSGTITLYASYWAFRN